MAYPGQYNRNPAPASSQYRAPPRQQPPGYAPYGGPAGGYAPYGAPPGRGGPPPHGMARGGYPPQQPQYPPQQRPAYGQPQPQYPPNTNFRQPGPAMGRGRGRGGPNPTQPQPSGGPMYYGRPGGPGGPSARPGPGGPAMLKRQASLLRSAYPNSSFCRVFLNTGGSSSSAAVNVSSDVTREVERPSIDYTFSYEETVLSEAIAARESESVQRTEVESRLNSRKSEAADGQMRKIASLAGITGQSEDQCRALLERAGWDLNRATGLAYGSGENLTEGVPLGGAGGGADTDITLLFPDQARLIFRLKESDTFWELYGRVIQGKPEYGNRSFNFRLGNGRVLTDANFDETLVQNFLTPQATIWVVNA